MPLCIQKMMTMQKQSIFIELHGFWPLFQTILIQGNIQAWLKFVHWFLWDAKPWKLQVNLADLLACPALPCLVASWTHYDTTAMKILFAVLSSALSPLFLTSQSLQAVMVPSQKLVPQDWLLLMEWPSPMTLDFQDQEAFPHGRMTNPLLLTLELLEPPLARQLPPSMLSHKILTVFNAPMHAQMASIYLKCTVCAALLPHALPTWNQPHWLLLVLPPRGSLIFD